MVSLIQVRKVYNIYYSNLFLLKMMDGKNVSDCLYELFLNNSIYHGGAYTGILRIIFTFVMSP